MSEGEYTINSAWMLVIAYAIGIVLFIIYINISTHNFTIRTGKAFKIGEAEYICKIISRKEWVKKPSK